LYQLVEQYVSKFHFSLVQLWNCPGQNGGRHTSRSCATQRPITLSGSYPWINILHAWLKICRKSSILPIRLPKIKNNRNRNVKYKSLQNGIFKLAYRTSEGRSVVVPNHIFNTYNYRINKVLVFKFYLIYFFSRNNQF
jgi:hypothetical protein